MAGSKLDFSQGFSGVSGVKYVVDGAIIRCDGCPAPSVLKVLPRSAKIEGKSAATIIDSVSILNIPNFPGPCKYLPNNPPCAVNTTGNLWSNNAPTELITTVKQPALIETAILKCKNGGTITIEYPGQSTKDFNQGQELDTSKLQQEKGDMAQRVRDLSDLEKQARSDVYKDIFRPLEKSEQMVLDHMVDKLHEAAKIHKDAGGVYKNFPLNPSNVIRGIGNKLRGR